MIPEHANWLVDNMSVTELHLYGLTLSSYPNILSVMIDVIGEHKPNQIHRDNAKPLDLGEEVIPTWLTIDVIDDPDPDIEPLPLVDYSLDIVGSHTFDLKNVELKDDRGKSIKTRVSVEIVDCVMDDTKDETDGFRYHRGMRIIFYV